MHARKTVCGDELVTYLPPKFLVTEQTKADRSIGNQQDKVYEVATNLKTKQTATKNLFENKTLLFTHKTARY